jgi:transcriptional regulator with XRE-family HTH domain
MATTNKPPPLPGPVLAVIRQSMADRRTAAGLSPEGLAAAAGLSPAAVRNIEKGFTNPSLGTLVACAAALGCHPAELLGGRPPAAKKS